MAQVRIKGLKELKLALEQFPEKSTKTISRGVRAATEAVFKHVTRQNVPWDTGTLVRTYDKEVQGLRGAVFPTRDYAIYVHEGTPPHTIRADNAQVLADDQGNIFGPVVQHPGTNAQPFTQWILRSAEGDVNRQLDDMHEELVDILQGTEGGGLASSGFKSIDDFIIR